MKIKRSQDSGLQQERPTKAIVYLRSATNDRDSVSGAYPTGKELNAVLARAAEADIRDVIAQSRVRLSRDRRHDRVLLKRLQDAGAEPLIADERRRAPDLEEMSR